MSKSSGRKTPDSEKVNPDQIHFAAMSGSSADFGRGNLAEL